MLSYTITAVNCSCRTNPVYDEQLKEKVDEDSAKHGKKRFEPKDDDDDDEVKATKSTTHPACGLFQKGEHKVECAYTSYVACDKRAFVLKCAVTPGNVHDSTNFDGV
jgi:hypothetical protein